MKLNPALALASAVTTIAMTSAAQANCARPTDYQATVQGNTVTICPESFDGRHCPEPGMLRVGKDGAVVFGKCAPAGAMNPFVGNADAGASPCYVDECVPPGNYQYGYAKPFECCRACCGTSFFTEVVVTTSLPSSCASAADAGATPYSGNVPWTGLGRDVCGYGNRDDSGCAIGLHSKATGALLGFNGVVGALGLLLMARRRRARS